jgi:hypothetical protein
VDVSQLVQLFVKVFVFPFVLLPALGGGAVAAGYRLAKLPEVSYWRCWRICLASCCYGFLALIPLRFVLRPDDISEKSRQIIQLGVLLAVQLILVPLLLRNFSRKAVGVTCLAVLLTNVAAYLLLFGI